MSEIKINKASLFRQSIIELLSQSTIHGIPKAITSKRIFFRVMWVSFLVAFSIACFYYTTKSISEFFNYDTITTFNNIYEEKSQFPAISICNVFNLNFTMKTMI